MRRIGRGSVRRYGRLGAAAAAAGLVTVGLAACGSSGGSKTAPSATGTPSGTLKIITWVNKPAVDAIDAVDAAFMKKYPKVHVELQTAADVTGPYETLQETTVDSGSADIISNVQPLEPLPPKPTKANTNNWQFWTTHNVFMSLSNQPWVNDLSPGALSDETYDGQVYGMESGSYEEGVFYNKADFARYHLSVPTTYPEFLAVCQKLHAAGVTPLFDGLGDVGPVYLQFLYYPLMAELWYPYAPGHNLVNALETGSVKWTDPNFTTVMQREAAMAKYLEPNYTGVPWESMPGDFAKGSAAMLLDGSWDLPSIQQANPSLQVGYFPLPGSDIASQNQPYRQPNLTFSVLKSSKNPTAALKWLQFFSTSQQYDQYVDTTGISPSEKTGNYSSYVAKVLGPAFGTGISQTVVYPNLPTSGAYYDQAANWPTLQLDIVQGTMSPQSVEAKYESGWTTG